MSALTDAEERWVRRAQRGSGLTRDADPLLVAAVLSLREEHPGVEKLSTRFAVKKHAVVRARRALTSGREPGQRGPPRLLWRFEEEGLVADLRRMIADGVPLRAADLCQEMSWAGFRRCNLVPGLYIQPADIPTRWHARGLLKRHGLALRSAEAIDPRKSMIARHDDIVAYFTEAKTLGVDSRSRYVYLMNLDETSVKPPKRWHVKIVADETGAVPDAPTQLSRRDITMVTTICTDGTTLRSLFLIRNKRIPGGLMVADGMEDAFPGAMYRHSKRAWITTEIFREYITEIICPAVRTWGLTATRRAALFLDNHGSRRGENAEWLKEALAPLHVDVVFLPAYTSRFTQPLDVVPFGMFKSHLRRTWPAEKPTWWKFMRTVHYAFQYAFRDDTIQAAFARAGIRPFDPDRILNPERRRPTPEPPLAKKRSPSIEHRMASVVEDSVSDPEYSE